MAEGQRRGSGDVSNPPSGTVVDHVVTNPVYDFHLPYYYYYYLFIISQEYMYCNLELVRLLPRESVSAERYGDADALRGARRH